MEEQMNMLCAIYLTVASAIPDSVLCRQYDSFSSVITNTADVETMIWAMRQQFELIEKGYRIPWKDK